MVGVGRGVAWAWERGGRGWKRGGWYSGGRGAVGGWERGGRG